MKIGIIGTGLWQAACDALGIDHVELPSPEAVTPELQSADLAARVRTGAQVLRVLKNEPVDAIVDTDGAGLTFVEGPGGVADLKLTHECVRTPLVSFCTRPVDSLFPALPWDIVWQVLASTSWAKVFGDAGQVDELSRFGIPGAIHLPLAATEPTREAEPIDDNSCEFDVCFMGDASGSPSSLAGLATRDAEALGRASAAVRAEHADRSFFELYHSLYRCAPLPGPSEPAAHRAQLAAEYFRAKNIHVSNLAMSRGERFVIFLAKRLGDRLAIFGRGWDTSYGLTVQPPMASAEELALLAGKARIHLALDDGRGNPVPTSRHLEIAANGGFLLFRDAPEIRTSFKVGSECETFTDETELLNKIDYFLANPERRWDIARAGRGRVLGEHLAQHRLSAALEHVRRHMGVEAPVDSQSRDGGHVCRGPGEAAPSRALEEAGTRSNEAERAQCAASADVPIPTVPATAESPGSLLVLLNVGRVIRHCMDEMVTAARNSGIEVVTVEMGAIQRQMEAGIRPDVGAFARMLQDNRVRAVLGYTMHGLADWASKTPGENHPRSLFERLGIPHLMWWTDHPQWADEKLALLEDVRPLLASPNNHHFVKSKAAARELREILGWPNCYGLPVAENPDRIKPAGGVDAEYDIVTIAGSPPSLDPEIARFLDSDDPDVEAISEIVAEKVKARLSELWTSSAPVDLTASLEAFGRGWAEARCHKPLTASFWLFRLLEPEHEDAADWLRANPRAYFDAIDILWEFGRWQRTFLLRYLAKYFKVGVFGCDWSSVGLPGGGWVDYDCQPEIYAKGRIALNVSQAGDEEGVSHKPFQIAASGVPMLHINRIGLSDCFDPRTEVATFDTPRQARDTIAALLADPEKLQAMAAAAHQRLLRDHTWAVRLPQMLAAANVHFPGATAPVSSAGVPLFSGRSATDADSRLAAIEQCRGARAEQ